MDVLSGIKVIDLTMWAFVPSAGGVLAHWGADVIKIENPRAPDPMRLLGGSTTAPGDSNSMFVHYNRGKRGITLDLASDAGREVLYRLVRDSDVFITSLLPATRQKLRVDVEHLLAVNPKLVYAKGTGHGPKGPHAERGGYDQATWWCRGSLAATTMGVSGAERPTDMVGHGDGMSGMTLAGGICAALLKRAMTGQATVVDGSLMGTALWFNGPYIMSSRLPEGTGMRPVRRDRRALLPGMNSYRTSDGRFIQLLLLGDHQADWADLCRHLGRDDLATDARFATSADRAANSAEGVQILDEVFATRTYAEWNLALATMKGVWAPVQTPGETIDDVQTVANRFVQHVPYGPHELAMPAPPILFDEEVGDIARAPEFGEHTDEVLAGIGYTADETAALRAAGVIA